MEDALTAFEAFLDRASDFQVQELSFGHINKTYRVRNGAQAYILQRVNPLVFKNIQGVMDNIVAVSEHLQKQGYPHPLLVPVLSKKKENLVKGQWRLFPLIGPAKTYQRAQSADQVRAAVQFIAEFYAYVQDFDVQKLTIPVEGFLDFNRRYADFLKSLKGADPQRVQQASPELAFLTAHRGLIDQWEQVLREVPQRVIHADPKISNFLFDPKDPSRVVALIDWDTLMPGPLLYDFGDMVRSYTNLKEEDDSREGGFSARYYRILKQGFTLHLKEVLTHQERKNLKLGARVVCYVQALRFLTDFLNGDQYYPVLRPSHNLDRTKSQLHLLQALQERAL